MSRALIRLLSLICLLVAGVAPAEEPDGGLMPPEQLRVRVSPDRVKVGEPFTLEVTVTHAPAQRYELKPPSELGDFDYLGQERKRTDGPDRSTTTLLIKLSAFQLGGLDTPNLDLEVSAPEGAGTLPVPRARVQVDSSLPPDAQDKGADLYDVKPPEELLVRSWKLLYALGGLLAAVLLGFALARYLSRPKPLVAAPLPPPEPLHVRATKALDVLAAENLPGKGEFKPYYFRLSEIVRGYLGELYGFDALESTTPELLTALRSRSTPGLPVPDLATFAEASDYIRYAKQLPTLDDCKAHLELAYRIIHSTQAAPPSAPSHGPVRVS